MKTKEEQQEEKRIALSIRIKSLDLDGTIYIIKKTHLFKLFPFAFPLGLGKDGLKSKADEL